MVEAQEDTRLTEPSTVNVDFSVGADYPLVKSKFGVFNSGIVRLPRYERDIDLLTEVRPESLRIDLGWGCPDMAWPSEPVAGTPDQIEYDFAEMDRIAALLNDRGVLPYWSYCYMPVPLQVPHGDWRSAPRELARWGEILGTFAYRGRRGDGAARVGYHEVYNEPDNDFFFTGTMDDYLAMYDVGATAIRAADPEAMVGGPALACDERWVAPFLDLVERRDLPLDFFSFHWYPKTWPADLDLAGAVETIRRQLVDRCRFAIAEVHLNELNPYPIDYPEGGVQDKHALAAALLRDVAYLLTQPDITLVHWAQFMDSGLGNYSGMVSMDGHRKAVFNAFKAYAEMPVDRCALTIHGTSMLDGMASVDERSAHVLLWNAGASAEPVSLRLGHIPFDIGRVRVFRIDGSHASWGDDSGRECLETVDEAPVSTADGMAWVGELPAGGVVLIHVDAAGAEEAHDREPVATVIRPLHYYPDRSSRAYADFDKATWTFRLGMAEERVADAEVGVAAEDLPDRLVVSVDVDGRLERVDQDSILALRVDYLSGTSYAFGVLFHGSYRGIDLFDDRRRSSMPWGTQRLPDRVVAVDDLARFELPIREHAPTDWSGRVQVTAMLQNAGVGTRVRIRLRRS